jgi:nucleotide-binding universal stress UspA family protein
LKSATDEKDKSMIPIIKNILYATDLSNYTHQGFRYALSLAQHYQAQITLLHVIEPLGSSGTALLDAYISKETSHKLHQKAIEETRTRLHQRLESFCFQELNSTVADSQFIADVVVLYGAPAQEIVEYAKKLPAHLIVVGTHGYFPISEMLIGSTARKITQISPVPVLVVPMKKESENK